MLYRTRCISKQLILKFLTHIKIVFLQIVVLCYFLPKKKHFCIQVNFSGSNDFNSLQPLFCKIFGLVLKKGWLKAFHMVSNNHFSKSAIAIGKSLRNSHGSWQKSPYSLFWEKLFLKKITIKIAIFSLIEDSYLFVYTSISLSIWQNLHL